MSTCKFLEANTSVFWDIEDCPIPNGLNVVDVSHNIKIALANMGYRGPVSINAYGNSNHDLHSFSYAGIRLSRTPAVFRNRDSNRCDSELTTELRLFEKKVARLHMISTEFHVWSQYNPTPANVMLIVGDIDISKHEDFIKAFNRLQMRNYNCLLAQPKVNTTSSKGLYVTSKWLWTSLSIGGKPIEQRRISQLVDDTTNSSCSSGSSLYGEVRERFQNLEITQTGARQACVEPSQDGMDLDWVLV